MQISSSSNSNPSAALYAAAAAGSVSANTSTSQTTSSTTSSSASMSAPSLAPTPSSLLSSATLMSMLQQTINGPTTADEEASIQQYASDPSADPQFMDVSGITDTPEPTSGSIELMTNPVSASGISSIESQLGVVGMYGIYPDGAVDTNSVTLFTDSGQQASNAVDKEFWGMVEQTGISEETPQSMAMLSALTESEINPTTRAAEIQAENQQLAANIAAMQDIV